MGTHPKIEKAHNISYTPFNRIMYDNVLIVEEPTVPPTADLVEEPTVPPTADLRSAAVPHRGTWTPSLSCIDPFMDPFMDS